MVGADDWTDPKAIDEFKTPIVRMDDGTLGVVLSLGAHVSKVAYKTGGIYYEVLMPNEDFVIIEQVNFKYEDET